ncbi:HNH endonuclease [Listeria newyorkensis]|uniref:HNH endonuclease n=1 Tax=Listeria newyorkensis TaxID=1497681 RepID=A0A841YWI3_9LIST|nr:HNH endonuclease [Listeria newyorkensis]MBC1457312.1 HNH endonuclease [Listeria newyorkensis]
MYNFRVIKAKEDIFIKTRDKFHVVLEDFKHYAHSLTIEAGNSKTESGKASSYTRYLIRLIIFCEESNNDGLSDLTSFETLKKIEKIKYADGFKLFNHESSRFYSATLNCYLAYVTHKNTTDEELVGREFNYSMKNLDDKEFSIKEENVIYSVSKPKAKPDKIMDSMIYSYPRSAREALEAKKRSNWTCEFNQLHKTFTNNKNSNPHVEAHHLIPMAAQDYFENTIDFADNILCLCPNCHSRIHYAVRAEKKEMIVKLFMKRKHLYLQHGIEIDEKLLLIFYGIV